MGESVPASRGAESATCFRLGLDASATEALALRIVVSAGAAEASSAGRVTIPRPAGAAPGYAFCLSPEDALEGAGMAHDYQSNTNDVKNKIRIRMLRQTDFATSVG